jgi:hypothetical protein
MEIVKRVLNIWETVIIFLSGAAFAFFLLLLGMIMYNDPIVYKNTILYSLEYFIVLVIGWCGVGIVFSKINKN